MDIKAYIASGKLEHYVLGLLPPTEAKEVERMAAQYSEIKAELAAIEETLATYARGTAMPMPEDLVDKIANRVRTEAGKEPLPPRTEASGRNRWSLLGWLLAALAVAFAVWATIQQRAAEQEIGTLQSSLTELREECDEQLARLQTAEEQLSILRDPNYRTIRMQGTDLAPNVQASIYYNPADGRTYLDTGTLPTNPSDRQYQLWAIVDNTPISIGVFDANEQLPAWLQVEFAENPDLFAVTLEPRGGSASPTLDQMYVAGQVS